ncbi:MAG TPA: hypothetical protein VGS96_12785 [Thermoanaerobaculia bacterium]|nr:hypothetical protein [Thermoanaerobaculia bacterium]
MDPHDVRVWNDNQRAAAAREVVEMQRNALTPAQAFASAMALLTWDESQNGSPFERDDPVSVREDLQMWEAWALLRARWRAPR